ncbi:MAG TPA: hypothetical protein VNX70_00410 [Bryobacteraceae bacterium]|nr:hypothetical protein [Bryobacteraceae bacterium]
MEDRGIDHGVEGSIDLAILEAPFRELHVRQMARPCNRQQIGRKANSVLVTKGT